MPPEAMTTDPPLTLAHLPGSAAEAFAIFGYATVRDAITPYVDRLFAEADAQLEKAYPDTRRPPADDDGREGYFLPAMGDESPTSRALVDALAPWASALLGVDEVVPVYADITVFFGPTPWHTDIGMPIPFVKFSTYADSLDGSNGALRFVPGSHLDPFNTKLRPLVHRLETVEDRPIEETVHAIPHVVVDTAPGDVTAISGKVWHATIGGGRRLQWSLPFVAAGDRDLARRFLDSYLVKAAVRGYDGGRFPFYGQQFLAGPSGWLLSEIGGAAIARDRERATP